MEPFAISRDWRQEPAPALWVETAVGYALIQCALWTEERTQALFAVLATVWIFSAMLWRSRGYGPVGFGVLRARFTIAVAGAALALAALMLMTAYAAGTLHSGYWRKPPIESALAYLIWAGIQQTILQSFFFLRLQTLLRSERKAMFVAAILFALAHLPNAVLTVATAILGIASCALFRTMRSIYPLALAHAIVGLALVFAVPVELHHKMRVGIAYYESK